MVLDDAGTVYGIGKNDRYQCGEEKKLKDESDEILNNFGDPHPIIGFNVIGEIANNSLSNNERIVQMKAGKFHSLFLSEYGRVYALGSNIYGQLGASHHIIKKAKYPSEIFLDGLKIKQIEVGNHHSLLLDKEGKLYAFGSNLCGQVTSNHSLYDYSYLYEIKLPSDSKIVRIRASNLRS